MKVFSKQQNEAIQHMQGPMLVISGPGSGKTTVITERIRYLIQKSGVSPDRILVITFTKAAATEMQERCLFLCQKESTDVTFGTFHSVFFRILREQGFGHTEILSEEEILQFMSEFYQERMGCTEAEGFWYGAKLAEKHSRKINSDEKILWEDLELEGLDRYQEYKRANHKIDYDDMMMLLKNLFQKHPEVLREYQNRWSYIMVDEFQDINQLQYDLIRSITGKRHNLFVVGDDDQAIYSFRGSDPRYMKYMERDYPEVRKVFLVDNYRCLPEIVWISGKLIDHNQNRYTKMLRSGKQGRADIRWMTFSDRKREYVYLAARIRKLHKQIPYREIGILFRTHQQSIEITKALEIASIPYVDPAVSENPTKLEQIIDNIFRMTLGLEEDQDLTRQLFPVSRDRYQRDLSDAELKYHTTRLRDLTIDQALRYLWNHMGLKEALLRLSEREGYRFQDMKQKLRSWIRDYEGQTIPQWFDKKIRQSDEGVRLMTMHASKGLEFRCVFIMDLNDGMIPYEKALEENSADGVSGIEEERRLLYVAVTRAKECLELCYIQDRGNVTPSRFINEMK